jgi:hypothetical protein
VASTFCQMIVTIERGSVCRFPVPRGTSASRFANIGRSKSD